MVLSVSTCFLGVVLFVVGATGLFLQKKSLLMVLLYLEVCNLGSYVALFPSLSVSVSPSVLLCFLSLSVCEASVGLAVLVMLARSHGNDYVSTTGTLVL